MIAPSIAIAAIGDQIVEAASQVFARQSTLG
jgi:hypothetical protein